MGTHEGGPQIHLAHIPQHARAQGNTIDGKAIAFRCRLGLGRTAHIVPDIAGKAGAGFLRDFVQDLETDLRARLAAWFSQGLRFRRLQL